MIGEALITRLASERLAAIKKCIPLRDSVREKLQHRQQAQTDFSDDTQQLFSPVTKATTGVASAITQQPNLLPTLQQIASETKNTQRGIQQLSSDIKTQHEYERLADIDDENLQPVAAKPPHPQVYRPGEIEEREEEEQGAAAGKDYSPENIFTIASLNRIRRIDTDYELANFARENFPKGKRENLLKDEFEDFIKSRETWASKIYLAKHGGNRKTSTQHPDYNNFLAAVRGGPQPPPYMADPIPEEIDVKAEAGSKKRSGKGYSNGTSRGICDSGPGNILRDISRLEVLIGGKRAGNNSIEITNEAADICRR